MMLPILIGVLIILLCLPLVGEFVGPNRWYGIRIPAAFRSEDAWYEINRFGGLVMIAYGGVLILCGLILPRVFNSKSMVIGLLPLFTLWIPLVVIFYHGTRYEK